jgi:hypothetical protein
MGVETVRADGNPTVFHNGSNSSRPISAACSPNEVKVVQPRRERWAQEASSKLSANMAPSFSEIRLLLGTP